MNHTEIITLRSGRRVGVHRLTTGSRPRTVIFCHAAPGAGNLDPDPAVTAKRQITLLAVDRPGYGATQPITGEQWPSVAMAADELAEAIEQLGIGQVGIAGWSAGGRIALALAARHPSLVDRVVILGTPAPDEAVPWIPAEQKQALDVLRELPPSAVQRQLSEQLAAQLAELMPPGAGTEAVVAAWLGRTSVDDAALALPGVPERLDAMLKTALAQGVTGMAADIAGYCLQPWGFTPGEVQAKTLCLYGTRDHIDARHGRWWQQNLPNARLEMVPDAGHLLIFTQWARVLSHLAPGKT